MATIGARAPGSAFLLALRRALLLDFQPELVLCQKVAVLQAAGHRRSEIARILSSETPAALRVAEARVKKAAERLDFGED